MTADQEILWCPHCDFEGPESAFPHLIAGGFSRYGFECRWELLSKVRCPGCNVIVEDDDLEEVTE